MVIKLCAKIATTLKPTKNETNVHKKNQLTYFRLTKMKYHGPLYGKIDKKYVPLKQHSDYVDKLEREVESQRQLAEELIATIRLNCRMKTLNKASASTVELFLKPYVARLTPYKAPSAREE